jgi:hypothetical protein
MDRRPAFASMGKTLSAESATRLHNEMLERKAHATELGEFYRTALARQLWDSQAKLARALRVSAASVSRAISVATLPRQVLELFREVGMPSARMAHALVKLVKTKGAETIVANANELLHLHLTQPDDIFTRLSTGNVVADDAQMISITVINGSRTGRHLRIDFPEMDCLIAALPEIRIMLGICLSREISALSRRKRPNIIG